MKVLITGVAGLLGSRLADWLIENKPEIEVIGIDDFSGGYKDNLNSKIKFYYDFYVLIYYFIINICYIF